MNKKYKTGDKIIIDGKQGVIDSTFVFAEDESILGAWVKFGNKVKYYTIEEFKQRRIEII